ncbi:hypothetical protein [Deinococcus sp.]|nr:hypothetical protein [Deinococcus sp.]
MYVSDLSLITKARLLETQDVALSQPPARVRAAWVEHVVARLRRR